MNHTRTLQKLWLLILLNTTRITLQTPTSMKLKPENRDYEDLKTYTFSKLKPKLKPTSCSSVIKDFP